MVSHVYFALHSRLPALKVGKGNIVENRLREIGIDYFNIANSFALQVSDEGAANNLERIFHRTFRHKRWVDPADLPSDGISEWFSIECLNSINSLFDVLSCHIEHKKIPIVLSEKSFLQERAERSKKPAKPPEIIYSSKLDGLVSSVNLLTDWIDRVQGEYPNISISYVDDEKIIFQNYPMDFIAQVDSIMHIGYRWQIVDGEGTSRGGFRLVNTIRKKYRPNSGLIPRNEFDDSHCMDGISVQLSWKSFPYCGMDTSDVLDAFKARWLAESTDGVPLQS